MNSNKEYLWYLHNRKPEHVFNSSMRDLLHDASNITDTMEWCERPDSTLKETYPEEYADNKSILEAVEDEIYSRLNKKFANENDFKAKYDFITSNEQPYVWIDFLYNSDLSKVHRQTLRYIYWDLYKIYDFLDTLDRPNLYGQLIKNAKKKPSEIEYCKKMLEALERTLYIRLGYSHGNAAWSWKNDKCSF